MRNGNDQAAKVNGFRSASDAAKNDPEAYAAVNGCDLDADIEVQDEGWTPERRANQAAARAQLAEEHGCWPTPAEVEDYERDMAEQARLEEPPTEAEVTAMGDAAGLALVKAALRPETLKILSDLTLTVHLNLGLDFTLKCWREAKDKGVHVAARALWDLAGVLQGYAAPVGPTARQLFHVAYDEIVELMAGEEEQLEGHERAGNRSAYLAGQGRHEAYDQALTTLRHAYGKVAG
jgi:hypothetical protein